FRKATRIAGVGVGVFAATLAWVASTGGEGVTKRFTTLIEDNPTSVYGRNRGVFLIETFSYMLDYPLGAGLGRWGQMYHYFGDRTAPVERGLIWVEIQPTAWVIDGGAPLFLGYVGAIVAAMASTLRIALRGADPEVADWAAVVFAMNLGTV